MYSLKYNILNLAVGALIAHSPSHVRQLNLNFASQLYKDQAVIESICVAVVWNFSVVFGVVEKKQGKKQRQNRGGDLGK